MDLNSIYLCVEMVVGFLFGRFIITHEALSPESVWGAVIKSILIGILSVLIAILLHLTMMCLMNEWFLPGNGAIHEAWIIHFMNNPLLWILAILVSTGYLHVIFQEPRLKVFREKEKEAAKEVRRRLRL